MKAIHEFVEKHAEWVEKKQAEIASFVPEGPRQYQAGDQFLYLGQEYPLELVGDVHEKLLFEGSFKLAKAEQANAETIFRNWYRQEARELIGRRVAFFAEKYQLQVANIRITSARTRWGSCNSKGALSFSWRLVMTPPDVIDYVVIHELAHTIHHNHSKRFWSLVEKWLPDYKERRRQLRRYRQSII